MTASRKRVRMPPAPARTKTRTEEQYAAEQVRNAARDRSAAVTVCDRAILAGCAGSRENCSRGHGDHVAGVVQALRILGIIPDPGAQWLPGPGYAAAKYRKRKKEAG